MPPPEPVPRAPPEDRDPEHRCEVSKAGFELVEAEPVVVRARWGALPPRSPPEERAGPIGRVFVVDTRTTQCKTMEECKLILQDLQGAKIYEQGEEDLPYK